MGDDAPRPHVLVIDDTPAMRDLLQDVLAAARYHVSTAEALLKRRSLLEVAPDVIVLEANIAGPHGTGWQYLTMIRRDPDVARIPLVLCTTARQAVQDPAMARSLERLGVQVLLKPFDAAELVAAVANALASRTLLDQVRPIQDDEP